MWNTWDNQTCLQGFNFEANTYRKATTLFNKIETNQQIFEAVLVKTYKKDTRENFNYDGQIMNKKGGEYTSSNNPDKGCSDKIKKISSYYMGGESTRSKSAAYTFRGIPLRNVQLWIFQY